MRPMPKAADFLPRFSIVHLATSITGQKK